MLLHEHLADEDLARVLVPTRRDCPPDKATAGVKMPSSISIRQPPGNVVYVWVPPEPGFPG